MAAPPLERRSTAASPRRRSPSRAASRRLLRARGFATVTELPLRDGRRADIVGVNGDGALLIVEIKSSVADFRADHKWRDYAAHCDRLYFAVDADMPPEIMPEEAGLIVADSYGAEILREPAPRAIRAGDAARDAAALRARRRRPAAPARRPRRGAGNLIANARGLRRRGDLANMRHARLRESTAMRNWALAGAALHHRRFGGGRRTR